MVLKGDRRGQDADTTVVSSDDIEESWVKMSSKDIADSTLGDFVEASGERFDAYSDNGRHAAIRMTALL